MSLLQPAVTYSPDFSHLTDWLFIPPLLLQLLLLKQVTSMQTRRARSLVHAGGVHTYLGQDAVG